MLDIMIPYWGDPDLLFKAIESVQNQTDPRWRLTVIDDCYPVDIASKITDLSDDRITYVRNETNLGIIKNFRRCIELSREEYLVFFGCDDIMKADYVALIHDAISRYPKADIIAPSVEVIDEEGHPVRTIRDTVKQTLVQPRLSRALHMSPATAATRLLWGDWLYWPSLVFRRDTLSGHDFRDEFPIILDLAFLIDLVADGAILLCLPETAFAYRRHASSASSTSAVHGDRFADEKIYFGLAEQQMRKLGWKKAARNAHWHLLSRLDALTIIPAALAARQWSQAKLLINHVIS